MTLTIKLSNANLKADGSTTGIIEGYASTFNNLDTYNDTIRPGAFTDSLAKHAQDNTVIPVLFEHDRRLDSHVGEILEAKEDDHGLYIKAQLDMDTDAGARAFNLAKGRRIKGMSIGFYPEKVSAGTLKGKSVNVIEKVDLKEVSLVLNPADAHAVVTSVKSATRTADLKQKAQGFTVVRNTNPSRLLEDRNKLIKEVKSALDQHGDYMPDSVYASVTQKMADIKALTAKIEDGERKHANIRKLNSLDFGDDQHPNHTKSEEDSIMNKRLAIKSDERLNLANTIAQALHVKAGEAPTPGVVAVGDVLAPVPAGTGIMPTERAPLNLLAAIPTTVTTSPAFSYLRQTLRELNADVVAVGGEKPKSKLGFERVDTTLDVVAHIVREVDEYILRDLAGLKSFISNEMVAGVFEKVEALIVDALNTADGAQVQTFTTDAFTTTRLAKAKLQSIGLAPAFYMINHDDWALMETTKAEGSGNFLFNSAPVNTTDGTLWGVPVLPTIHTAPGAAKLIATESAALFTDGEVRISVNTSQADFEHNQVSFRAEGRFKPVTVRSMGIVDVPLVEPVTP